MQTVISQLKALVASDPRVSRIRKNIVTAQMQVEHFLAEHPVGKHLNARVVVRVKKLQARVHAANKTIQKWRRIEKVGRKAKKPKSGVVVNVSGSKIAKKEMETQNAPLA